MEQAALFVAVVLVALVAALAIAHAAHKRPQTDDPAAIVARMQHMIRRYGLLIGLLEGVALVALIVAVLLIQPATTAVWLVAIAAVSVAVMGVMWSAWLRPLHATVIQWTPASMPAAWSDTHRRWLMLHRVKIVLAILALALLLTGVFARPAG